MNKFSNLIIYTISNFVIDFNDLVSLSLISKTFREGCKIKLDNLKHDYYLIENILKEEKNYNYYQYLKIYFNPNNKYILNSWYKYGYYIFPSRVKLDIPKIEKFKITIYGIDNKYKIIIKKKKKYRV
jgi:biotin-(acetyl-CoA carboxylase) ligase